jgi:hypothetical protein
MGGFIYAFAHPKKGRGLGANVGQNKFYFVEK